MATQPFICHYYHDSRSRLEIVRIHLLMTKRLGHWINATDIHLKIVSDFICTINPLLTKRKHRFELCHLNETQIEEFLNTKRTFIDTEDAVPLTDDEYENMQKFVGCSQCQKRPFSFIASWTTFPDMNCHH